jgi:hypothetical protein
MYSNCQFISGCTNIAGVWNQELAEVPNRELAEVRNQRVAGIRSRELTKLWNHGLAKSCGRIPEIRES